MRGSEIILYFFLIFKGKYFQKLYIFKINFYSFSTYLYFDFFENLFLIVFSRKSTGKLTHDTNTSGVLLVRVVEFD